MAAPRRRINGVPNPKYRGTRIPAQDPASRRAQRTSGPTGPGGGGSKKELNTGCVFLAVLVLTALAIVAYVYLTRGR